MDWVANSGAARNVMIADDGKTPILMDFGSTMQARVHIENRSQALLQQVRTGLAYVKNSDPSLYRILPQSKVRWPTARLNSST